jgi:site-specific recombinase XerD
MDKNGFIAYLESKGFAINTIKNAVKYTEQFFTHIQKEDIQITKPDILKFLEYLKNSRKIQNAYRRHYLDALKHYFTFLGKNEQISKNPCLLLKIRGQKRKTLYKIYTPEELDALFDNYYQFFVCHYDDSHIPKNQRKRSALNKNKKALLLSVLVYQGTTTREIEKIEINDVDLIKATLKIRGGQHSNSRTLPLKATQIGLFMHYLQNIRPQFIEYQQKESDLLFLALPDAGKKGKTKVYKNTLQLSNNTFPMIAKQVKSIDEHFFNFKQVRASVITNWLKTQGLRKAQYLAGHRYISSTESYLPNNLDDLIDDINKLHPFDF